LMLQGANVRRLTGLELWRLQGGTDETWARLCGDAEKEKEHRVWPQGQVREAILRGVPAELAAAGIALLNEWESGRIAPDEGAEALRIPLLVALGDLWAEAEIEGPIPDQEHGLVRVSLKPSGAPCYVPRGKVREWEETGVGAKVDDEVEPRVLVAGSHSWREAFLLAGSIGQQGGAVRVRFQRSGLSGWAPVDRVKAWAPNLDGERHDFQPKEGPGREPPGGVTAAGLWTGDDLRAGENQQREIGTYVIPIVVARSERGDCDRAEPGTRGLSPGRDHRGGRHALRSR
jgi:hypothetical protein